jgi:selenocysteine-specific translation elongation factor
MDLIEDKSPLEIAERLYELSEDMDYMDYEDTKEQDIAELENALYWLKAAAQNDMNKDYFRYLYNILQRI